MREKAVILIVAAIMLVLMLIQTKISTTAIEKANRTQAEAFQAMTDAVTRLNTTLTNQRDAPLKVTLENLPPAPSVACTVTMPPEPEKKRGRR